MLVISHLNEKTKFRGFRSGTIWDNINNFAYVSSLNHSAAFPHRPSRNRNLKKSPPQTFQACMAPAKQLAVGQLAVGQVGPSHVIDIHRI